MEYHPQRLKADRTLSWLMRSRRPDPTAMAQLARAKQIYLIGDAAYTEPIIGGHGAQAALHDALSLAETLGKRHFDRSSPEWYMAKASKWEDAVTKSERRLEDLLSGASPSSASSSL